MFRAFRIGFTITGRNYTDELQDVNSREYEATAVEILAQVRLSIEPLKKRVLLLSSLLFFVTFVYNLDCLELLEHIRNNYMGDCLAHIHRLKRGGCCAPFWEGAGSPSKTMWPRSRPACMPSFILIHPTVWPQCTNVTDRQDI